MEHRNTVFLGLLRGANHHLVGNSAGKQDHQIGRADLLLHGTVLLGEYLRFVSVFLTYFLVATNHTLVAADNYYAHNGYPFYS